MDGDKLTIGEAARAWGVSRRTVFRWIKQGRVEAEKVGKETLVPAEKPRKSRVEVIEGRDKSDERHDTSLTQRNDTLGELALSEYKRAKKSQFRWQMFSLAAVVTAGILGGVIALGYGLWQGRGAQLVQAQETLAATRMHVDKAEARVDAAERRQQEAEEAQRRLFDEVLRMLRQEGSAELL